MNNSQVVLTRQSNMELLRIIAMFMVLVYHVFRNVLMNYSSDNPIIASIDSLLLLGVPLFVLLSGYFGINPSVKKFFSLYVILLFYNFLFYGLHLIQGDISFTWWEFIKLWFPFSRGSLWFFKVYMMLFIISPALNVLKEVIGNGKLLIINGLIVFYWGWFACYPGLNGKDIVTFSFLYLLGSWLKMNIVSTDVKKARFWYILAFLMIAVCVGLSLYFADNRTSHILHLMVHRYNSPILILESVFFFLMFTTFEFKNKFVNWVATSALAVYIVHENSWFFKKEWYGMLDLQYQHYSGVYFIVLLLFECLLLFSGSILLDKVRVVIMRPIMQIGDKLQSCYVAITNKVTNYKLLEKFHQK